MSKIKENGKLLIAILWVAASILSLFVSIASYRRPDGTRRVYALQDMPRFGKEVLSKYTGSFRMHIGPWALVLLCVLAVVAIVCALVGIAIMTKQKPVRWPYILTLTGVIGTAIPAIAVFVAVCLSGSYFPGRMTPGFYPIITPIAMVFCLILVIMERKRILRASDSVKASGGLIRRAGDL